MNALIYLVIDPSVLQNHNHHVTVSVSDPLFLRLAASGSKSPIVDIIEHAPCVPTPHLTTPLAASSTSHPIETLICADMFPPPTVINGSRPSVLRVDGAEELIRTYKKAKKEREAGQSKWSEDAKKRYDEYQKMLSQY